MTSPATLTADELAARVGHVTLLWNDIHFFVYTIFVRLMGGDYIRSDAIFFALRSDKLQRDFTDKLSKAVLNYDEELAKKISKYISSAGTLASQRNSFIHAMWVDRHSGTPKVFEVSSPKLAKADIKTELDKIISSCAALVDEGAELDELVEKTMKRRISIEKLAKAFAAAPRPEYTSEATEGPHNHLANLLGN